MKIRGGHENGRQLDSLHFYRVPWPPRSGRQKHLRASEGLFRKSLENQRVLRRGSPARFTAFLQGAVATSSAGKTRPTFLKNCFGASRSPEGAPQMAASPIDCIFTMPRATARSTAYLQGGRAQGAVPPCKYAVDLFCGRPRARRSPDGTFSPPWRLQACPKRPQEKVLKIRGGHQDGRKLDSLHFYRVP